MLMAQVEARPTPLGGRSEELAQLRGHVDSVLSFGLGDGVLLGMLLCGARGVGKSRLAELVAELRSAASAHVADVEQLIARYTTPTTIFTLSQLLAHIMSLARSAGGGSGGDPAADLQHLYSALASLSQPAQVRSMYRDTSTCGTAAGECSDVKRWVATVMDCK